MQVIPAIDLLDGKVVRLQKGDYDKVTIYDNDPTGLAHRFKDAGFNHIHIVDLNGAKEGKFVNLHLIKDIINKTGISVQSGGGIRTFNHASQLFDSGVRKVVCGSMAIKNETDWFKALSEFGGERCILGMDLKDGKIAISGWTETSPEPMDLFLDRNISNGLTEVLCTDISRDGMLTGVNQTLYAEMMQNWPSLKLIASGGVSGEADLAGLSRLNIYAVVVGRAFFEGLISLKSMQKWNTVLFH